MTGFMTTFRNLGLDALEVVNLRVGGMIGTVRGINRGTVERAGRTEASRTDSPYRTKQHNSQAAVGGSKQLPRSCACRISTTWRSRNDDAFIDDLAAQGIAYVPFFPLGGFTPLQSSALDASAASLQATPMQVALAWLLQRSPNILLIPGTSSLKHLRENLQATTLQIPAETLAKLDSINEEEKEL